MTESVWSRRAWSGDWPTMTAPNTITVTLPGYAHLRKVLIHDTMVQAWSTIDVAGTVSHLPMVVHQVEWFPAGGAQRRIYTSKRRIPTAISDFYKNPQIPASLTSHHHAGDLELGVNEKYNYAQDDRAGVGTVQLTTYIYVGIGGAAAAFGWYEGTLSVLGQYG